MFFSDGDTFCRVFLKPDFNIIRPRLSVCIESGLINNQNHNHNRYRGFTLVELIVASVITAMLISAVTLSTRHVINSRDKSQVRQEAFASVNAVTQIIARDIRNIVRKSDLRSVILQVVDDKEKFEGWDLDRLLIFSRSMKPVRTNGNQGEDGVYEVEYLLVPDNEQGGAVWRRRDPIPDEFYDAGGVAVPLAVGILSLNFEVYNDNEWLTEYDSDEYGIPYAVRVTCEGKIEGNDIVVWARACVAIDRYPLPIEEAPGLFDGMGGGDTGGDTGGAGGGTDGLFGGGGV